MPQTRPGNNHYTNKKSPEERFQSLPVARILFGCTLLASRPRTGLDSIRNYTRERLLIEPIILEQGDTLLDIEKYLENFQLNSILIPSFRKEPKQHIPWPRSFPRKVCY